jgi:tRNA-binding EMAP/Myf-like protein
LKPGTDPVFDIPFAILYDGTMDTVVIKSNIIWTDLHFRLVEVMVKSASQLNLGYKFSTDACNMAPNCLANGVHLLELVEGAKDGLEAVAQVKKNSWAAGKKAKPFKVKITDLDAGKDKGKREKVSSDKGKCKKQVQLIW